MYYLNRNIHVPSFEGSDISTAIIYNKKPVHYFYADWVSK